MTININQLVRPNIQKMKPYASARDEFKGAASVFLDANENPFPNDGLNRSIACRYVWRYKDTVAK